LRARNGRSLGVRTLSTEEISPDFADLDLKPTHEAVALMAEGQCAAAAVVAARAAEIAAAAEAAAGRLRDPAGRLIYVGAGTSGRIAVQDGVELVPTFNWDEKRLVYLLAGGMAALTSSIEGAEDDAAGGEAAMRGAAPGAGDVAIGVSASGRTAFTVAALRAAAAAGALTVAIASNAETPLLAAAAHPLLLDTGPEVLAGSTRMKAGTAQKIALNLLSTAIMLRLGRVYKGMMVDMRLANEKLRKRAAIMVGEISGVDAGAAEAALDRAGGDLKLAALIAMGVEPERAAALLDRAAGNLRDAIARRDADQSSSSS
jgi:N-acetylmuramic acid 6-phosphate etherase